MTDLRPSARAWVELMVISAFVVVLATQQLVSGRDGDWLALAVLLVCAAIAHIFPIRPAFDNVTYHLTSAFMIAGAMVLSPLQAAILAVVSLAPDLWLRRHIPGVRVLWAFNSAQTALATVSVLAFLQWTGTRQLETFSDALALLIAVGLFTLIQAILVGVVVALNAQKSLLATGTLSRAALLSDLAIGLGGLLVAGLWMVKPALLVTAPALLVVLHRATRNTHLAELADHDPKTGLYNARFLERALEDALQRAKRHDRNVVVLFADLDRFKRVNDRHGHEVGDRVLRGVGRILQSQVGRDGIAARYGGEEFVVLLPRATDQDALALAERIRQAVEQHAFDVPNAGSLSCTISIGLASAPEDGSDKHALLSAADAALREAKTGRNCVARANARTEVQPSPPAPVPSIRPAGGPAPRGAALLLWTTVIAGGVATLWSLVATLQRPELWTAVAPFLAAAIVAEFLGVDVYQARRQRITLSFSMAATMAAVAAQPVAAPTVSLIASIVATIVVLRQRNVRKVLFNLANPVLASLAAAVTYAFARPSTADITIWNLGAALGAVLVFVAFNVGLISLMISLHTRQALPRVLKDSGWFAPTNILLGLTGAFVGGAFAQLGPVVVAMFVVPVLLMRYTLAFYARRSQETIRTLESQAATLERQADRLEHLATHDALTDLPNRLGLERRLDELLNDRSGPDATLLLLDLNRFKEINDTFGHQHGDLLLKEIGPRLQAVLKSRDTIARLGADEFAVLLSRTTAEHAERVATDLRQALTDPFIIEGYPVEVTASVGVATSRDDIIDSATLLRHADIAMNVAKRSQAGQATYRPELDQHSPERLALVAELRFAIENDGLSLVYQPQVPTGVGSKVSAEALLRWHHPTRGTIAPDQFVGLAERTGLIRHMTHWVIDQALRQCRAWLDSGYAIAVAVNASMHDVHDAHLPEEVAAALDKWHVPANYLRIEVTEGTLMADAERTLDVLGRLRSLGVDVAVDDFGTGYSSLTYLSQLPVNELKIDRSFVADMRSGGPNASIVRSTITLGHDLGLRVVAEGVEDEATWRLLRKYGCDAVQGFWLSHPIESTALIDWLETSGFAGFQCEAA